MGNNLGTIAKSGTKAFMEALTAGADIEEQRGRRTHVGVRSRWIVHDNENSRCEFGSRNSHSVTLERRYVRILGREAGEGLGEEAFGVHRVPHKVVHGEDDGEGG